LLERPGRRRKEDMKIYLKGIELEGIDSIDQDTRREK